MRELKDIAEKFRIEAPVKRIEAYGSGHIHDTYKVETDDPRSDNYILQKLNNKVFKNIPYLQENINTVTKHIYTKLLEEKVPDLKRRTLTVVPGHDGTLYYTDQADSFWRMYIFISDHRTYNIAESLQHAREGGRAIGKFQSQLSDLDSIKLHETIPYFHDIEKRLETFYLSIERDKKGRVQKIKEEIAFVKSRIREMGIINKLGKEGKIPLRITHNDTKFNNILLDSNDRALCVIDLDTVMPGYIHYDFGDAIRTTATRSAEDETDLKKVELDIKLFEAYSEGYLSEMADILTTDEIAYLAFSPRLITFTIGLRFLTDYIDGDKYFKIHHPDHNLERAKTQFKLVESNERQYNEMKDIIDNIIERYK